MPDVLSSRRNLINGSLLLGGISAMSLAASAAPVKKTTESQRPNIILIMTDQQTAGAMSIMGNPHVNTPAMDALAADGVMLTRAYCPFPLSNPCRASLLTGYMPWETGVKDNGQGMNPENTDKNLGFTLSRAGYDCLYAGKWHIPENDIPENAGFTKIAGMDDQSLVDKCVPYLKRKSEKPFFLVASFLNPHEICEYAREETLPYGPLDRFQIEDCPNLPPNFMPSTYEAEAIRLHAKATPKAHDTFTYTQDDWRRYMYAYYRLVERVDREVGRLVEQLKTNGLYDNSVIIFCSDHGDGVASHQWNQKWVMFEEIINVPLIVKAPKNKGVGGVRNDQALSNIGLDIFVTVCDYADVQLDQTYKGKSIRPLAEGRTQSLHDEVFIETLLEGINVRGWCIVEGKYKYVLYNWFQNREQLYDLENDRGEMVNLAVDIRNEQTLKRLRKKMYEWGIHINDPRLIKSLKPIIEK